MTEQIALDNLKILEKRWLEDEEMFSSTMTIEIDEEFMQSIYKAKEVLEKQIPKKPIIKTNLMTKHVSAHCSICDTDITYYSSEEKYCHKCGQAIKWE